MNVISYVVRFLTTVWSYICDFLNLFRDFFSSPKHIYPVIFVGAGPANISACHYLHSKFPYLDFLIIDAGINITKRDHNSPKDCFGGIGGAGLFSDGKFSWAPAGTAVWKLENKKLRAAYAFIKKLLDPYMNANGDTIPEFPEEVEEFSSTNEWTQKKYETHYLSLEQRKALGIEMTINYFDEKQFGYNKFSLKTVVIDIKKVNHNANKPVYALKCRKTDTGEIFMVCTHNVVIGGGRFAPILLSKISFIPRQFKRVELGVRFEGKASNGIYNLDSNSVDPKFMYWDAEQFIEYRSFCTCRDGETCVTSFDGINTWSGRSDCEPTGLSNFGFNLRFKNEKYLELLKLATSTEPFTIKMKDVYKLDDPNIKAKVGNYAKVLEYIREGLESFISSTGIPRKEFDDFDLKGPTIEGVGHYPVIDDNLKVPRECIWITGDSTGIFRGIIASQLSGVYVGLVLAEKLGLLKLEQMENK